MHVEAVFVVGMSCLAIGQIAGDIERAKLRPKVECYGCLVRLVYISEEVIYENAALVE
jgi:hypothetical protein